MEALLETVDADVEVPTELLFKVTIEGLEQAPSKVRLVCEDGDTGHVFVGKLTDQPDVVSFNIPANRLKETTYLTKVEVLVENRYFTPVVFNLNAKKLVKVVAEAVKLPSKAADVKVIVQKVEPVQKPTVKAPQSQLSLETLKERAVKKRGPDMLDLSKADDATIAEIARSLLDNSKR